jgi:nudix-type nucleoside diphosphatase (YffH/AdpP family)
MDDSPPVIVRDRQRVFHGYFELYEVTVSHRQFDGKMSPDKKLLVFERGDAVAALLFNKDRQEVVLVEQFRVPTLDKSRNNGWLIEAVAGMIRAGETPEECVVREVFEETGYRIKDPEHVATFFSSPGGSSERIFLFYAVVKDTDWTEPDAGNRDEGEDIRIVTMKPEKLSELLRQAAIEDPKLIIAAYHLKSRIDVAAQSPMGSGTIRFTMKSNPELVIGIKTGEILKVEDVDVWVNSENTDMMMDRIIDRSISANIRYGGAEKDAKGMVRVDTIAEELRDQLDGRVYVQLGTVLETGAGALATTHNVRRIVHVAAVDWIGPGQGVRTEPKRISEFLTKILRHVHERNSGSKLARLFSRPDRSILVPLLGAGGEEGLTVGQVAPRLVGAAVEFFQSFPQTELKEIYLLAYQAPDKDACMKALLERNELQQLKETTADGAR